VRWLLSLVVSPIGLEEEERDLCVRMVDPDEKEKHTTGSL